MEGVSLVELEERSHKFGQSLKFEPLACHDDEHEAVYQLLCECLSPSFLIFPDVLLLLAYLQIDRSITCMFFFPRPIVTMMK